MWTSRRIDEWGEYHSPAICYGKSSPSPPQAPSASNMASQQNQYNQQDAEFQAALNNVDQYTPYGNLTYSQVPGTGTQFDQSGYDKALAAWQSAGGNASGGGGGSADWTEIPGSNGGGNRWMNTVTGDVSYTDPGASGGGGGGNAGAEPTVAQFTTTTPTRWQATQTLTPAGQKALDSQQQLTQSLYDLANNQEGRISSAMSQPFDMSKVPAMPTDPSGINKQAEDTVFNAQMAELNPVFSQQRNQMESQMVNQGIAPGDAAYGQGEQILDNSQGATTQQAAASGVQMGQALAAQEWNQEMNANQTGIQEQEFLREEPLNEAIALMGGGQISNPSFAQTPQTAVAAPDVNGAYSIAQNAANTAYQGRLAQASSGNNAMAGLAGAGMTAAAMF